MDFKELGFTRIKVPEVGLGTWRYAGGREPLIKGIELGGSFIDTAESYGSEEVVGEAIREFRSKVFVATKASPRNFRRADLLRAADGSLKRLSTTYVDLYQLHWPNYTIAIEETMGAMEELVDAGKIRFIGVSNFSVHMLKRAQAALSKHKIVSDQVRYSLIERTVERDLVNYCQRNGITLIAYSPFGSKFSSLQAADPEGVLVKVAETALKTPTQVALNRLLAKANVVAIPKASTVQHVIEDGGASGWRLSPSEYELLDSKIKFRKRSRRESAVRRCVTHACQILGRHL